MDFLYIVQGGNPAYDFGVSRDMVDHLGLHGKRGKRLAKKLMVFKIDKKSCSIFPLRTLLVRVVSGFWGVALGIIDASCSA